MKIATSPFVYWGVAVFMPEKLGNLQISPPSQAQLSLPNDRLCVYALGKDVAPRRGKLVVGAGETWYNPAIAIYQMMQYVD